MRLRSRVAIALQQFGMESIMQLVCRDRNRLALEAEIAGAALPWDRETSVV